MGHAVEGGDGAGPAAPSRRARPRWTWALVAVGSLAAAWPLATLLLGDPFGSSGPRLTLVPAEERARALYRVPAFEHVDQQGRPFGSSALLGRPWIASFFFTSCPSICPRLMRTLAEVQDRLEEAGSAARIVSFTVDPVTDTPEKLAAHAAELGADPDRWTFVTGEPAALYRTIVAGFKQPMGDGKPEEGERPPKDDGDVALDIAHGVRFVLVDAELGIRGLYDADAAGVDALLSDLALLPPAEEPPR